MDFKYFNPVHFAFGRGEFGSAANYVSVLGKKALIVTYPDSHFENLAEKLAGALSEQEIDSVIFSKVMQNPLSNIVSEGGTAARDSGCDVIVGIGGGSALDTAKGIAVMAVNEGDIFEYIFGKELSSVLPVIAIATTAGTGSEGNCTAVFTNPDTHDKKGLVNPLIFPAVSIVDPELMMTQPKSLIAGTGADALFHSIESYISVKSNPYSEMLSLKAMELIYPNLYKVYEDPADLDSWDKVSFASSLAGMAIGSAGTTIPHALSHPLGGLLDIVHSEGLAAIYRKFMEFTYKSATKKFAQIAKAMGKDTSGMSELEAAESAIGMVDGLITDLGVKKPLSTLGVRENHINWLTNNALTTMKVVLSNNPVVPNEDEIKEIFRSSL